MRAGGRGFTLVELLAVIGIIAVLVALLMPVLRRARDQATRAQCRSQLRQLAIGVQTYVMLSDGYLPGPSAIIWPPGGPIVYKSGITDNDLRPTSTGWLARSGALKNPRVWLCPADQRLSLGIQFSYTYNCRLDIKPADDGKDDPPLLDLSQLRRMLTFREPARDIVFAEENTLMSRPSPINDAYFVNTDVTDDRHLGACEAAYLDGHSEQVPPFVNLWRDRAYFPR